MQTRQCLLLAMLAGSVFGVGCGKPKEVAAPVVDHATNQAAPVALEPWELRAKELFAAIKTGMSEDEVVKVAGDPKMVKTAFGVHTGGTWQYELGDGNWLTIQFDKSNRVDTAGLTIPTKPQ